MSIERGNVFNSSLKKEGEGERKEPIEDKLDYIIIVLEKLLREVEK